MQEPALWSVALNAFAAVIVLLGALALAIRALGALFPPAAATAPEPPPPAPSLDAPTLAAVQVAVQRALPGARVVHVEESPGGPR